MHCTVALVKVGCVGGISLRRVWAASFMRNCYTLWAVHLIVMYFLVILSFFKVELDCELNIRGMFGHFSF